MKCRNPECDNILKAGAHFCEMCGTPALSVCTSCGEEFPTAGYLPKCPKCGAEIRDMSTSSVDNSSGSLEPEEKHLDSDAGDKSGDHGLLTPASSARERNTSKKNKKTLLEYLGILVDMENSLYTQKTLLQNLVNYSGLLAQPKELVKPTKPIEFDPMEKEKAEKSLKSYKQKYLIGAILVTLFILYFLFFINYTAASHYGGNILGIICAILFVLGIVGGYWVISWLNKSTAAEEKYRNLGVQEVTYKNELQLYEKSLAEYNQNVLDEHIRIEKETKEKEYIDLEIQSLREKIDQSDQRLNEFYNLGIVGPKYHDMASVNTIYEYFQYERCSTLGEAYNLLEHERTLNRIILQLDRIIAQLESIKQNQYTLYTGIKEGNRIASEIAKSTRSLSTKLDKVAKQNVDYTQEIKKLQASSSITAYNSERINKEMHYMNRMKYLSGEYDGVFFNQQP